MTAIGGRPEPSAVRINRVAPDRRRLIGPISDYTVGALGVTNEKDPPIRTLMPISVEVGNRRSRAAEDLRLVIGGDSMRCRISPTARVLATNGHYRYSSALESAGSPMLFALPPITSTAPFRRSVLVWPSRGVSMLSVAENVPLEGSNTSAVAR